MSNTYAYNGLGQRSGKVDSTGTFNFTRNSDSIDAPVVSDGAARYVQGATGLISEVRGGASKYYHADALGSTRAITNTSGVVTDTKATDAFGITYSAGTSGSTPTPFGFAGAQGYQSDSDTGLMLLGHRYYDASVGRFLSRDPVQDGSNWYVYCGNDPVNHLDPTGHQYDDWNPFSWDYNFDSHDWHTIAQGIDDIGTGEMGGGGAMFGLGNAGGGFGGNPNFPANYPRIFIVDPGETPKITQVVRPPWGIPTAIGGGLLIGGGIAKLISFVIKKATE